MEIGQVITLVAALLVSDASRAQSVEFWREAECRGMWSKIITEGAPKQREMLAAFVELRRRGKVPEFDRKWCIDNGFLPFRNTEEKRL